MNIKVRGIEFYEGDQGDRPFTILAHGAVTVGAMTISGVALTWTEAHGAAALSPSGRNATGTRAVQWDSRAAFAKEIAEKMLAMFKSMGGELPNAEAKRKFIPFGDLDVDPESDVPLRDQVQAALDRIHGDTGEEVYTSICEFPEPEAGDNEAAEGLQRFLGLDAVEETMARAGL